MQAVVVSLLLLAAPPVSASGAQKPGATGNPESAALARVTCSRIESLQKELDRIVESLADAGIDRAELDSRIRAWRRRTRELEIRVHRFAALREADWLTFERRVNQDIDRLDSDLDAVTRDLPPGTNRGPSRTFSGEDGMAEKRGVCWHETCGIWFRSKGKGCTDGVRAFSPWP